MAAAVLWTAFAAYGCGIQSANMRWATYKYRLIRSTGFDATVEQRITTLAHIRINAVRSLAVAINLCVGILALVERPVTQTPPSLLGLVVTAGFLINEFGWDAVVTLEILGRRRLRRL